MRGVGGTAGPERFVVELNPSTGNPPKIIAPMRPLPTGNASVIQFVAGRVYHSTCLTGCGLAAITGSVHNIAEHRTSEAILPFLRSIPIVSYNLV